MGAHGNTLDLVFFALLAGALQSWFSPGLLFRGVDGSEKTEFAGTEVERVEKFAAGLSFMLGMTFSGVKWNPANGKMAGLGAFVMFMNSTYLAFQTGVVYFVLYACVLLVGGIHIFAYPSNEIQKHPKQKNNHGNVSDITALLLLAGSLQCMIAPWLEFQNIGPIKASFGTSQQAAVEVMIRHCGGHILIAAMMFSGIKWNPINGKMAGLGAFTAAACAAYFGFQMGLCLFFLYYSGVFLLGGMHVFVFPANPLPEGPPKPG